MNLKGKVALITGGSRGIGEAIALKLASVGANIAINYSSSVKKANNVIDEVCRLGSQGIAVKANISVLREAEKLIEKTIETYGKIDILVNNAGITRDNLLMRMTEEEWDDVLNVNLKGTFNVTKSIIRKMIKQKSGSIINVSSVVGITGNAGQCNYSASKAGIIGFTKSLAKEVGRKNIRVNAIAPGFIKTDMTEALSEELKQEYLKKIPLNRLGTTEDIANAVLFLASDMAQYITGQVIVIDGGMSV